MILEQKPRPVCQHCKFALAKKNGKSKLGFQLWHKYCIDCSKVLYSERFKHLSVKASTCEECGFVPQDMVQLDVIYKDGNKKNKNRSNLKTVCANCGRLHNKNNRRKNKSILNATADIDTVIV